MVNSSRVYTALGASLAISGACTFALAHLIQAHRSASKVADLPYVTLARDLKAGELIKADALEIYKWPGDHPLSGAFLKPADVLGRAVLYPLAKGEPILDRDLAAPGAGAGLAAKIPEGMRAIALRSDEIVGVAGFLTPGSHVDVLVTYHGTSSPDPVTTTVLEDSEVVAVGQRAQPDPEGKPNTVTVVTLLLSPDEAERAVMASTQGTVHFVLRNGSDRGHSAAQPLLLSMLAGGAAPPSPEIKSPSAPAQVARLVPPTRPAATRAAEGGIETVLGGDGGAAKAEGPGQP
jgi:pilus assembly protein CpaB